jgi:hypothetical protein
MDDALRVSRRQAARHLHRPVQRCLQRDGSLRQPLAERLPLQQFGDQVRRALVEADVEDHQDVGVVERPCQPRLLLEAPEDRRIPDEGLPHHLERHVPAETRVPCPVDLAHPARSERRQDLVRTEPAAGGQRHGRRPYATVTFRRFTVRAACAGSLPGPSPSLRQPPRPSWTSGEPGQRLDSPRPDDRPSGGIALPVSTPPERLRSRPRLHLPRRPTTPYQPSSLHTRVCSSLDLCEVGDHDARHVSRPGDGFGAGLAAAQGGGARLR